METAHAVSVEEYLNTSYEYDPELIDGYLRERPMPTNLHAFVQAMVVYWFAMHMDEWSIMPLPEVRTRVTSSNFRLPDVAITHLGPIRGKTQDAPPLIAIEILSPDDRISDLSDRATDFSRMGVEHIWLIDPETRETFSWAGTKEKSWLPADRPEVPGTAMYLDLGWLWSKIPQE